VKEIFEIGAFFVTPGAAPSP